MNPSPFGDCGVIGRIEKNVMLNLVQHPFFSKRLDPETGSG
jgi:hypothetical protein